MSYNNRWDMFNASTSAAATLVGSTLSFFFNDGNMVVIKRLFQIIETRSSLKPFPCVAYY